MIEQNEAGTIAAFLFYRSCLLCPLFHAGFVLPASPLLFRTLLPSFLSGELFEADTSITSGSGPALHGDEPPTTEDTLDTSTVNKRDRVPVFWLDKNQIYNFTLRHIFLNRFVNVFYDEEDMGRLNWQNELRHLREMKLSIYGTMVQKTNKPPLMRSATFRFMV